MTATVPLYQTGNAGTVLPDNDWAIVLLGRTKLGDGPHAIITFTVAPMVGQTLHVTAVAMANADFATTAVLTEGVDTVRLGPLDLSVVADDEVQVWVQGFSVKGGVTVIDSACVQGDFTNSPYTGNIPETGISIQPQNQTVAPGNNATFTVSAVGQNVSYTWEESTDAGQNWSPVGTNQNSYTKSNPQAGDSGNEYRVTVTGDNDPGGNPVVSNVAVLTVSTTTAAITIEPSDMETVEPAGVTFQVTGTDIDSWTVYERTGGAGNGSAVASDSNWQSNTVTYDTGIVSVSDNGKEYRFALRGTDGVDQYSRWSLLTVTSGASAQVLLMDTEFS